VNFGASQLNSSVVRTGSTEARPAYSTTTAVAGSKQERACRRHASDARQAGTAMWLTPGYADGAVPRQWTRQRTRRVIGKRIRRCPLEASIPPEVAAPRSPARRWPPPIDRASRHPQAIRAGSDQATRRTCVGSAILRPSGPSDVGKRIHELAGATAPHNKEMKLTKPGQNGASQLISSVVRT